MESPFFVTVATAIVLASSMDKSGAPLQLLEIGPNMQCSMDRIWSNMEGNAP